MKGRRGDTRLPPQKDLDGRGEARGEKVRRELWALRQQLVGAGTARAQQDDVLDKMEGAGRDSFITPLCQGKKSVPCAYPPVCARGGGGNLP